MAKIGDYTQLNRKIPQVSGNIDTRGVDANIGAGLMDVAGATSDLYQRKIDNQLAKAKADMSVSLIEESNALDEDPDYATHDERFTRNIEGRLGEISSTITDPARREAFVNAFRPNIASARESVKNKAWEKEKDFEIGGLSTRLETLRNTAITSGNIAEANESALELIDSHTQLGHVNADDAVKIRNSFRDDLSKGYIESQDPEKRGELLKQPWAKKYLAPDVFAKLKRDADSELLAGKAQGIVQDMDNRGINWSDSREEISKIKDPKLKKAARAERDYVFARRDKAVVEGRTQLKDKWYDDLALGDKTVKDIQDSGEWDSMGADLQREMINAQKNSVKATAVPFNFVHHDNLYQLKVATERGDKQAGLRLREYVLKNYSTMSAAQQKTWSSISIDGVIPAEVDSGLTDIQAISSKLPKTADAEKRRVMLGSMGDWRKNYISQFGKSPTPVDRDNEIDRLFLEYDVGFWGTDTKFYEMEPEQARETTADMKADNPEAWKLTQNYFVNKGYIPSQQELMQVLKSNIDAQ